MSDPLRLHDDAVSDVSYHVSPPGFVLGRA
jgi:hypothetical protein